MRDGQGREIRYLRLSITSACGMRCIYCRPLEQPTGACANLTLGRSVLTPPEIERLARHLVQTHGLRKVRLTGGEPTCRPDLLEIVDRLARIPGLDDLAMTTNGLLLERLAPELAVAGLKRVNVSLDSLDRARFRRITGTDALTTVLAGIEAARAVGFRVIKLNTVVLGGLNDSEMPELLYWAVERDLEIRFIELMPMGAMADVWQYRFVSENRMRAILAPSVAQWEERPNGSSAARGYHALMRDGRRARVGFISAMSCPFCACCDRVRVESDGTFYFCLMDRPGGSVLPALRPVWDPWAVDQILREGLLAKKMLHPGQGQVAMARIGG